MESVKKSKLLAIGKMAKGITRKILKAGCLNLKIKYGMYYIHHEV